MDELVQWLGEQLDIDAERARRWHDLECGIHTHLNGDLIAAIAASRILDEVPGAVCDCDGPAQALREIEAKRDALAHYLRVRSHAGKHLDYDLAEGAVSIQIKILALPYNGRLGYREGWRP